MARQFDVFRRGDGMLVVVIQRDLLEATRTRVVAPSLSVERAGRGMQRLDPQIIVDDVPVVLMPQLLATLAIAEMGELVGSVAHSRDQITRALDALLSGV